eukprot:gene12044-5440_t
MIGKILLLSLSIFSTWWLYNVSLSGYSISLVLESQPKTILTWLTEEEKLLKWNEEIIQSKIIGEKEIKVGFRMRRIYKINKKELTMFFKLLKYKENHYAEFICNTEAFTQKLVLKFQPEHSNSTKLLYEVEIEWNNFVSKFFSPLYTMATKLKLKNNFEKLKELINPYKLM